MSFLAQPFTTIFALAIFGSTGVGSACAQEDYPGNKPVSIVVGYPAGGSVDFAYRILSDAFSKSLGAPVVIDNVGGAAGAVGAQKVVSAQPNGYTLLGGSINEIVVTKMINNAQKYDGAKDLVPIGLVGSQALVLVASTRVGVTTLDGFISAVKKNPGKYSYGTSGVGSILHLAGEMMKERAGLFITHIPYRGAGNIGTDVAGGTIEFAFLAPNSAKPLIDSGKIVAIAVTSPQRLSEMPQVPTLAEHPSLKGYELVGWYAMMAPRGTPEPVVTKLRAALRTALKDQGVLQKYAQASVVAATGNEDLGKIIAQDTARLRTVADFAKLSH